MTTPKPAPVNPPTHTGGMSYEEIMNLPDESFASEWLARGMFTGTIVISTEAQRHITQPVNQSNESKSA